MNRLVFLWKLYPHVLATSRKGNRLYDEIAEDSDSNLLLPTRILLRLTEKVCDESFAVALLAWSSHNCPFSWCYRCMRALIRYHTAPVIRLSTCY